MRDRLFKSARIPLAVQERTIRAEENLPFFSLTGKVPAPGLTIPHKILSLTVRVIFLCRGRLI
jgi:hypothetical protein